MIVYVDRVQGFDTDLLSSWTGRGKIHSSSFVFQELTLSYGWNTSRKINTNFQWISKLETMSVFHVELKWFRDRAARLTATCNQIDAPCEQLPSKKAPDCAWSIQQDVGQGLRMQETFSCSYYGALLATQQVLKSVGIWRILALLRLLWEREKDFRLVSGSHLHCSNIQWISKDKQQQQENVSHMRKPWPTSRRIDQPQCGAFLLGNCSHSALIQLQVAVNLAAGSLNHFSWT